MLSIRLHLIPILLYIYTIFNNIGTTAKWPDRENTYHNLAIILKVTQLGILTYVISWVSTNMYQILILT